MCEESLTPFYSYLRTQWQNLSLSMVNYIMKKGYDISRKKNFYEETDNFIV